MAEDLTDYLSRPASASATCTARSRHCARVEILRELRLGEYDVIVGINLLREGLDLPEVSLVAILDADKEGFLRSAKRSLIQTIGRAARNVNGQVILYADNVTGTMQRRSPRPTAAATSRSPTTRSTASIRRRFARRSATSRTCWLAKTPTPTRCSRPPATGGAAARLCPWGSAAFKFCRQASSRRSSSSSPHRCMRQRLNCSSKWQPGSATRSATSRRNFARCSRQRPEVHLTDWAAEGSIPSPQRRHHVDIR